MKIRELAHQWEQQATTSSPTRSYRLDLEVETAARLEALCELYPQRTPEALLGELLAAAFEELEASFPYVQGEEVVATDELGDPLYADAGTTPRFLELARKHLHRLQSGNGRLAANLQLYLRRYRSAKGLRARRNSIASEHFCRMSGHRVRPQRWTRAGYQYPSRPLGDGSDLLPRAAFT